MPDPVKTPIAPLAPTAPTTPTTVTIQSTAAVTKGIDTVAARKEADKKIQQKQEALTKANEAVVKAHGELMEAQREAAHLPPVA